MYICTHSLQPYTTNKDHQTQKEEKNRGERKAGGGRCVSVWWWVKCRQDTDRMIVCMCINTYT